ncbi:MAG: hypothetical protein ACOCXA_03430 [Planctomycetota bacterium]
MHCPAGLLWCCLFLSACTARVEPPTVPAERSVQIHLWEAGMHSGVILPLADGRGVSYEYGEWSWVLERRNAWWRFFPAMLWPSRGYLMRREITDMDDAAALIISIDVDRLWTIAVEAEQARRLRARLLARFRQHQSQSVPHHGHLAVPDDHAYHIIHNCNRVTGRWLRHLGCRVIGDGLSWNWTVQGVTPVTITRLADVGIR